MFSVVENPTYPTLVLVVEDDPDMSDTLCELLAERGYESIPASNGAEALAKLRARDDLPSIILLDVMMPVMDGRAFRIAQLADQALSNIPVIVLTAQGDIEYLARDMKASGFLRKPVRLDPLLEMIRRHCSETI